MLLQTFLTKKRWKEEVIILKFSQYEFNFAEKRYITNRIKLKGGDSMGERATSAYGNRTAATSAVGAEAQQGNGPASSSASSSTANPQTTKTSTTSAVAGVNSASASCNVAAVAVGPQGAAAASEVGVATIAPYGAAASSNAANSSSVAIDRHKITPSASMEQNGQ